jgi:hypothetical protein
MGAAFGNLRSNREAASQKKTMTNTMPAPSRASAKYSMWRDVPERVSHPKRRAKLNPTRNKIANNPNNRSMATERVAPIFLPGVCLKMK